MAKQVKIRGDSAVNLAAATPAARELGVDTTNKRLIVGDGSTAGGIPHVNAFDDQKSTFSYAGSTSGTNTYTATLTPTPAAYTTSMRVLVKIGTTCTGSSTLNLNGLGAVTLKKVSAGALANVASGDLVAGVMYWLIYDGTYFQIIGGVATGLVTVAQGDLDTSSGTFSETPSVSMFGSGDVYYRGTGVTAPGGQYGFTPETRITSGAGSNHGGWWLGQSGGTYSQVFLSWGRSSVSVSTSGGQQRYINSSPPFDMGDGEVNGFIFLNLNSAGDVVGHYAADVPPWGYNGPTRIRADKIDEHGRKYRRIKETRLKSVKEIEQALKEPTDGEVKAALDFEFKYELITQEIKNRDMKLIPQPFVNLEPGHSVVMIDPMAKEVAKLLKYQNEGEDLFDFYARMKPTGECKNRKGPVGVPQVKFKVKHDQ